MWQQPPHLTAAGWIAPFAKRRDEPKISALWAAARKA
jgi:hypothetical protein